jgi:Nif-specific regulatory protein
VLPLLIPPLRQRKDDIEPLADFFLQKFNYEIKKNYCGFSEDAIRSLLDYSWPGNIRELENCVERACVLGTPPEISARDLRLNTQLLCPSETAQKDSSASGALNHDRTLKTATHNFKRTYIREILKETAWNKTETGKILGIQRTYLPRLLHDLGIQ